MSLKKIDRYLLLERVVQVTKHFLRTFQVRERDSLAKDDDDKWRYNIGTWQKNDPCREDNEIKTKEITMKKRL